jgi:cellulose synthase operon protein C
MIFLFPNLETLRIALTSGMAPPSIAMAPVEAAFDAEGRPSVKSHLAPPKAMQNALKRLGVKSGEAHYAEPAAFSCWPEILPVVKEDGSPEVTSATVVLFEMPATQLGAFAIEMLRLGNDRQSFRYLDGPDSESPRVLLRVVGPPYYTLLRALDRLTADVVAYVEKAPRTWIEAGCSHPLQANIKVPEGQVLLLRPPRSWSTWDDGPFQDIYEILDFQMPTGAVAYEAGKLDDKLTVHLRLAAGNAGEPPEMWVLKENAVEIFDSFVRDADERLLARLTFAVVENGEKGSAVVLRVRQPSKLAPPTIELSGALGFVMHRRIQNLFVPAGTRLQPTLRRDAVKKMLAQDDSEIVWLTPLPDGRFIPESIADDAFRPLQDWVDYVIDLDHQALQSWIQDVRFDFESFICTGDQRADPAKPPALGKPKARKAGGAPEDAEQTRAAAASKGKKKTEPKTGEQAYAAPVAAATASEHALKRNELEQAFLAIDGPLEAPERIELWPQLARVNAALSDYSEAALCWVHALWEHNDLPAAWMSIWYHSEVRDAGAEMSAADLDRDLAIDMPTQSDMRQLAARLLYACARSPVSAVLKARLPAARSYLEKHDHNLGVRATWLVWLQLTRISGDVLGLARVRDRLIERLFKNGLKRQFDVPNFIHFAGQRDSNRLRRIHDHLVQIRENVGTWLSSQDDRMRFNEQSPGKKKELAEQTKGLLHHSLLTTSHYADLLFAYAFAKIGDERQCDHLLSPARAALTKKGDPVHQCLADAMQYRVTRMLHGHPAEGTLPAPLVARINELNQNQAMAVSKLRLHLHILEPHEKTDPYLASKTSGGIAIGSRLTALRHITDSRSLESEIRKVLDNNGTPLDKWSLQKALREMLFLSTRVGAPLARDLLKQASAALTPPRVKANEPNWFYEIDVHALLADSAIWTAASVGWADIVQQLLKQFVANLRGLDEDSVSASIKKGLGPWVRFLRKFGLRDQVEPMLREMTELLLRGRSFEKLRTEYAKESRRSHWIDMLLSLLQLAEYWIYFGWDSQAAPIVDEARRFLFEGKEKGPNKRIAYPNYVHLASAYIRCVGQIDDIDVVAGKLNELLNNLDSIPNATTTQQYFSVLHLTIVENLVLALVSDDFIMGETARRWLDDDEYLVRRRIHGDMKKLLAQTGL